MAAPTPDQLQLIRDYEPALNFYGKRGEQGAERFFPSDAKRYLEHCALWRAVAPYATRSDWGAPIVAKDMLGAAANEASVFLGAKDASGKPLYLQAPSGQQCFLEISGWKSADHYADLDALAARYADEEPLRESQFWYHAEFFDALRLRALFETAGATGVDFGVLFNPRPDKPAVITDPALICYYLFYPGHDESLSGCIDPGTGQIFDKAREYGSFAGEWCCIAVLLDRPGASEAYAPKYAGLTNRNIGMIKVGDREVRTGMRILDWSRVQVYEGTHPRFSVGKGTHGLYLLDETNAPVDPVTSDDTYAAFCGSATPIVTVPPEYVDPKTAYLLFAKLAAGAGLGAAIGGALGASIGGAAGLLWGIAEIGSSHETDGSVAPLPPTTAPKQDDLSSIGLVVHPVGKRPAGVEAERAQEWRSSSQTINVDGRERHYDFTVDRETQVLWGDDPIGQGFTGRWGPFVEEDPDTRRAGMTFPMFWKMFFDALVRSDAPAKVVTLQAGTTAWTVPDDWNSSNNTIELIGGGGAGSAGAGLGNSGAGGGGGAYVKYSNVALQRSTPVTVTIGAGGLGATTPGAPGGPGGDTSFSSAALIAKGGAGGVTGATPAGGAGGSIEGSTAAVKFPGGAGGGADAAQSSGGGGGGGAGGPKGAGAEGGSGAFDGVKAGGGGGGGGNGGGAGGFTTNDTNNGGKGGANADGVGSGAGGTNGDGAAGTSGGGGGGGFSPQGLDGSGGSGGDGGPGTDLGAIGGGGGGGGGGKGAGTGDGGSGRSGGQHGGGGGGGGRHGSGGTNDGHGGDGGSGVIVIIYRP